MTFTALLTKELRLRLRRERFVWLIIIYLLVMGLLGFGFLQRANVFSGGYQGYLLSQIGAQLYALLSFIQLFLIVFIAPAFTATAINGEKERQTFDLLLCSKLSAFSLLAGKLIAGLVNVLLLIVASIPLFSLVFFFGGVSPLQVLITLVIFIMTAIVVGTFSLCCSTLIHRSTASTAVAYTFCAFWLFAYPVISILTLGSSIPSNSRWYIWIQWLNAWNPISALNSAVSSGQSTIGNFFVLRLHLTPWVAFTLLSLVVAIILFVVSIVFVKPDPVHRWLSLYRN
ncbi:MAG TPA: ABC transporter permease subunit, partial [Ktedonobacteraceae bacterium]|nr:ABC transporter permease subunit [Ktedonobacteraceae bacterium]